MRQIVRTLGLALVVVAVLISSYIGYLSFWQNPVRELQRASELPLDAGRLSPKEFLELKNDVRKTGVQVLAGMAVVGGLIFTGWSVRHSRESINLTRDRHIMELYAHAVEQLLDPNKKPLVYQAALHPLVRVAWDSKRDHWPIMQLLTAYVRQNAEWKGEEHQNQGTSPPKTPPDIQAVLDALGQRNTRHENRRQHIDLSKTDLRGAQLPHAELNRANLSEAHLEGANLSEAHLEKADLWKSNLRNAYLGKAQLQRADLNEADLENTNLRNANLRGADLRNTSLQGTIFTEANLRDVRLEGTNQDQAVDLSRT